MKCALDQALVEETIAFHGHQCPGLTIGIRVAELARQKLDITHSTDPVCVTETDMCAVDAIQFLTGCSFGKGNLIHKDFGKSAFTFFNRETNQGFRAVFQDPMAGVEADQALRIQRLFDADLMDLFVLADIDVSPVRPARILNSMACDNCREMTMESRIRLFDGHHLCHPCFQAVEQKI